MRYILTNAFIDELQSRKTFIEKALNIWTVANEVNENIEFHEFPTQKYDVFFIYGHNSTVWHYLYKNSKSIIESTIVIITCYDKDYFSEINFGSKSVYITKQSEKDSAELVNGDEFGFEIDITLSELEFYRLRFEKDLISRLDRSFVKVL